MRKKNPLRDKMEPLKVKGIPVIVKTEAERADAFNVARALKFTIKTYRRPEGGFEIWRTA